MDPLGSEESMLQRFRFRFMAGGFDGVLGFGVQGSGL